MKKTKYVLAFIFGAVVFSIIGVKAATMLAALDVGYDNSNSNIQATTVQGAIDELYTKAAKKEKLCKPGYYTLSNGSSNYTCTKIENNQSVITLKLTGSGEQSFLNSLFPDLPNYVYVDGVSITPAKSYTFNSEGEHKVVLVWDYQVTSMKDMFSGCSSITSIDFSNFDAAGVTSTKYTFYGCSSLTSIDFSNFDTSNVTSMKNMFGECGSLTNLDLSSFNTSNVTDMTSMFNGCSRLNTLDLSNFNTSSVSMMRYMFGECGSLTNLDLSNFNTSNVTKMGNMFDGVPDGVEIKSNTATCNKIASDSGITASYTCAP